MTMKHHLVAIPRRYGILFHLLAGMCICILANYSNSTLDLLPIKFFLEEINKGLAKSRTHFKSYMAPASDGRSEKVGRVNTHTYLVWTEKGRKFIHDLAHRFWELAELYEVKNL